MEKDGLILWVTKCILWIVQRILWIAQRILWISRGKLWITSIKTATFPKEKTYWCGKMPVFVRKTVGKETYPVDNFRAFVVNLRLILLVTSYFLWITLLKLGIKLVQTCGKLGQILAQICG